MIKEEKVFAHLQRKYCDFCVNEIELVRTGQVLMSAPPQYVHQCPRCSKQFNLGSAYPTIVFRDEYGMEVK